jgi:hypothetical protein
MQNLSSALAAWANRARAAAMLTMTSMLLAGCAAVAPVGPGAPTQGPALPTGRWSGDVAQTYIGGESDKLPDMQRYTYTNCNGKPQFWSKNADGQYETNPIMLQPLSYEGTHVLYSFGKYDGDSPGWVESTVWTIMQLDEDLIVVQKSWAVHNRGVRLTDPSRSHTTMAYGTLRRVSNTCGKLD